MILGIICARSGSKRLPGKNRLPLFGKPLIEWTIDAAGASQCLTHTVLTTDDDEILSIGARRKINATRRPAILAGDDAPIYAEIFRLMDLYRPEWVVLLQPTSPLRLPEDIDACILKCRRDPAPSCVSVTAGSPVPNGAVYVAHGDWLREHKNFDGPRTVTYAMPPERSVDINTQADFDLAEKYMKERHT